MNRIEVYNKMCQDIIDTIEYYEGAQIYELELLKNSAALQLIGLVKLAREDGYELTSKYIDTANLYLSNDKAKQLVYLGVFAYDKTLEMQVKVLHKLATVDELFSIINK